MELGSASWFLYMQWAYALWQFVRDNTLVRFLFKLPVWFLFYRLRSGHKRRVFLLNKLYDDDRQYPDVDAFKVGDRKHELEIVSRDGSWVKAKFRGEYFISHENYIGKIWATDFNDDFVIHKQDITSKLSIATKLSKTDALKRIASSYLTTEVKTACIYTPDSNVRVNAKFAGFVATLPLLGQAKGYELESAWLSLAILALDIFRTPFYKLYDRAFEYIAVKIKLHVFQKRTWLYLLFSVFSKRWAYGDRSKQCVYDGYGHTFKVHTIVVFTNLLDYEVVNGQGSYADLYPAPEDQFFEIERGTIHALLPAPKYQDVYSDVKCNIHSVVV